MQAVEGTRIDHGEFYTEEVYLDPTAPEIGTMRSALASGSGLYLGDEARARWLIKERGLSRFENASGHGSVPAVASRGYAAIGLQSPKHPENIAHVLRAAQCYGAAMVAATDRYRRSAPDTGKAWRQTPLITCVGDLRDVVPFDCIPVAVDLVDDAECLTEFDHPERAFYVFGPEDGTLGSAVLEWCPRRVMVPTSMCMNLAATVNVVLYDRMAKQKRGAA